MKDYWTLKLWTYLKELTSKEWIVEGELDKWDLRFKCRLGDFRYHTEWYDGQRLTDSIIKKDAEIISMWWKRKQ